jgi:hypothetical protein
LIVEVALWVGSSVLVAVISTLCAALMVVGAVYKPLTTAPIFGLSDQVTAVLEVPFTLALNCLDRPADREGDLGLSETLTAAGVGVAGDATATAGPIIMVALAVKVGLAMLVAEIVTSESALTELGVV